MLNNRFIDTLLTGCKDTEFINLSCVDNKDQFHYHMTTFNQELNTKIIKDKLNIYGVKSGIYIHFYYI